MNSWFRAGVGRMGCCPKTRGIVAGWSAEQTTVFAVELLGTGIADQIADPCDVVGRASGSERASWRRTRF